MTNPERPDNIANPDDINNDNINNPDNLSTSDEHLQKSLKPDALDSQTAEHTNTANQTDANPYAAYHVHDHEDRHSQPYTASTSARPNWLWLIPAMLAMLAIGVLAGRWWANQQTSEVEAAQNDVAERDVTPQIATATGVTEKTVTASPADGDVADGKPVLTVETVTPTRSIIDDTLSADGTISPKNVATVNGKINGVAIDEVLVQEGDRVKQGQVLAVFDNDALKQQNIQATADLAEAETRFDLAKKDADRILPLVEMQAVSEQEADRYVSTARQAAASVAAAKARLDTQRLNMDNANVTAPVSGIISEKTANVGSVPGQAPLFTIIEDGVLEWQAQVDPNKVGAINVGTPVTVELPNNQSVQGKVTRIAPVAEQGSRQITIYATLAPHPNVRAGMYQRGTFNLGQESDLTIPVSSVVSEDGYEYVMQVMAVKDADRNTVYKVQKTKVNLGERIGDRVVLNEPLKGDGNIVRQGGSFLNDGDIVRLADDNSNGTATVKGDAS